MNKSVLIISYYWPPAGGPGVQRTLKFVKYLKDYGWTPIILTVEKGEFSSIDNSLESEIPNDCIIYKTKTTEYYNMYRKFTGKKSAEEIPTDLNRKSFKEKISNFIRLNLLIPDARIGWIKHILKIGNEIIKQHQPQLIFCSSPPHSTQIGAMKLAKKNDLKLISDFRDPWLEVVYYQNQKRTFLTKVRDAKLEKSVMDFAHTIITISPTIKDLLATKTKTPVKIIYNGFDKTDFVGIKVSQKKYFQIAYMGVMNDDRIPFALLKILKKINNHALLRLKIIGKVCPKFVSIIKSYGIEDMIEFVSYLPHKEAIAQIVNSQISLLVIDDVPNNSGFMTGKIFDYFGCMRPILAFGPLNGDANKLLIKTKSGEMFDYSDEKGTKKFIEKHFSLWKKRQPNDDFLVEDYTREVQTKQLAQIFNNAIKV